MSKTWKRLASIAAMALLTLPALAAAAETPASPTAAAPAEPGYTMPATHVWDMDSGAGGVYRIFVSFPETGEPPTGGYPVLYVLDGNASFAAFAEARRIQEYYDVGKGIVVGVGYPGEKAYDIRRLDDYTAPIPDPPPPHLRRFAQHASGGQDRFLDFLTGPLREEIARRYPTNPDRQSLFGHSLGGSFALHVLQTRPQAFHSIVAASPSLEWNPDTLREERAFTERLTAGKIGRTSRLLVVVGGRDVDDDPYVAEAFVRRMDKLSGYGLRSRLLRYEEEGHMSVPARAVTDTLRFVFEYRL